MLATSPPGSRAVFCTEGG